LWTRPGRIAGVVLAGGRSRRFGADKALAQLDGARLIDHSLRALRGHADALAVSGSAALAASVGLDAVADAPGVAAGPLRGVLGALAWAKAAGCSHLLSVPCDTPFLPDDLGPRLIAAAARAPVVAARAGRAHALCAIWSVGLAEAVATMANQDRQPSMQAVVDALDGAWVDFPDEAAFANLNTAEDLERARIS
jgi:molybdopterin-guanine dinucleotide biosynthesis protein A